MRSRYGLSYSNFSYKVSVGPKAAVALDNAHGLISPYFDRPFPPQHVVDSIGAIVFHVITVTNVGTIDCDDVVLGFIKPPGAGSNGVPLQQLYDFSRVFVPAGQSVRVTLNASANDFTQVSENGKRETLPGNYTFQFGVPETQVHGQGYATQVVTTTLQT